MRLSLFAGLFFLVSATLSGQNAFFSSLRIMDGSGALHPTDIMVDSQGNRIIIGNCFYQVDLDPGTGTATYNTPYVGGQKLPVFVLKLDSAGNHLWSGVLPAVESRTQRLQLDAQDNIYISGIFQDTMDFDISAAGTDIRYSVAPYPDAFVMKIDPQGNHQWAKTFGRAGSLTIHDMAVDHAGNLIFSGACEGGNLVFYPDATSPTVNAYTKSFYVLKYNASGNFSWLRQFGASGQYDCREVEITSTNDIIVAGLFENTIDFDPGSAVFNMTSAGSDDIFIMKLNPGGLFQWAKQIGNAYGQELYAMQTDASDKLYLTGELRDSLDFDLSSGIYYEKSKQWISRFVLKLDVANAGFEWVRSFVLTDPTQVDFLDLHIDDQGGVYTTGTFKREFYVHPDTTVNNETLPSSSQSALTSTDAFIHKFDVNGNYQWAKSVHANEFQRGKAVTTSGGKVLWAGEFENTVDFGLGGSAVNVTVDGQFDMFLLEMGQCMPDSGTSIDSVCQVFVTPAGDSLFQSGQYQYSLPSSGACDSIVQLDLTILTTDRTVLVDSVQGDLIAPASQSAYQWLDCDSLFGQIQGATSRFFRPLTNGHYAVQVISPEGCVDTSDCVAVNFVGLDQNLLSTFKVYPNPAHGSVNVDLGAISGEISVELLNVMGQSYYRDQIQYHGPFILDLPVGEQIYILQITWEDQVYSFRILGRGI